MESEKVKEIKSLLEIFANDNEPDGTTRICSEALTLINELESENDCKDIEISKQEYQIEKLKDRIAELEKGNEALSFAVKQGFNDCQTKILKQFAERLKENFEHECSRYGQLCDSECEYIIDETLKEFI